MSSSTDPLDQVSVYEQLLQRSGEGSPQPRLEPTRRAAELLGDPHKGYPIIHVTGTNGKTSTCRIAASVLRAHGLRVGLFTSPHLVRFNERIVIDGHPIEDAGLDAAWRGIQPALGEVDEELSRMAQPLLTFFEALTVLAFSCFARADVDVAVIEVGMGGQWDSTNVADGGVAVFTPISLDHTHQLGATIAEIARTKSGIIKPQAEVVSASQAPEATVELERLVRLTESTLALEGVNFGTTAVGVNSDGQVFRYDGLDGRSHEGLRLPLFGTHQIQNAGVAIASVQAFLALTGTALEVDRVVEGLRTASSPGRLETVGGSPQVILDAAHNPNGAQSLIVALRDQFDLTETAFVIGILQDKDAAGIVSALALSASRFYVTQSPSDRSLGHRQLRNLVASIAPAVPVDDFSSLSVALEAAVEWASAAPGRAVVVTGSISLISEAYSLLPQSAAAGSSR